MFWPFRQRRSLCPPFRFAPSACADKGLPALTENTMELKMNVHNLMEEVVDYRINKLYEQVKEIKASWLTCDCENCRLDAISYVLNRIQPKYVVSGRGALHAKEVMESSQVKADIDAIGIEGIRIVSTTKRPFHSSPRRECTVQKTAGAVFNFPTIQGTILDGSTFEPLIGATITLKCDKEEVQMSDITWPNPINTYNSTKGTYCFWPKAIIAEKENLSKKITFTLEVTAPGYDDLTYSFDTTVTSEGMVRGELDTTISLKLMDLVMFKSDIKNTMDRIIIN